MTSLLNVYFRMWALQANPQDLPVSRSLTTILASIYVLVSMISVLTRIGPFSAFAAAMVDLGLLVGTVHLLLLIARVPERGMQTLSAVFGASILLVILTSAMVILVDVQGARASLLLMLLAWYLLIFGHIMRQAIQMPVLFGALIGLLYLMLSAGLTSILFFPSSGSDG